MKAHTILLSIGISFACAAVFDAKAQTCRVNSGYSANGCVNYLEVYEFDYVEVKPEFPGGGQSLVNFINDHRRYPSEAYRRGIQGRVTCSFVVNADGTVSNICVLKGVEQSLDQEALRIFASMPAWKPGKIDGIPVPVRVIWPVFP